MGTDTSITVDTSQLIHLNRRDGAHGDQLQTFLLNNRISNVFDAKPKSATLSTALLAYTTASLTDTSASPAVLELSL